MMQDGKALQSGTSHYLGQNFSKAMGIEYTSDDDEKRHAFTTSWGVSTRMMGALVMTHADDNGLRLPPAAAPRQVKIVPITRDNPEPVLEAAREIARELGEMTWAGAPVRAEVDERDRKPAEKRWEWIRKGVPVVIELGERDIDQGVLTVTRRDDPGLGREPLQREGAAEAIAAALGEIQERYLAEATARLEERTTTGVGTVEEFREWFSAEGSEEGGFVRGPWSEDPETEKLMGELGVSVRCIPFDGKLADGAKCVISGKPATVEAIFAKAY
jgi:prolyl-tRNA synthetase